MWPRGPRPCRSVRRPECLWTVHSDPGPGTNLSQRPASPKVTPLPPWLPAFLPQLDTALRGPCNPRAPGGRLRRHTSSPENTPNPAPQTSVPRSWDPDLQHGSPSWGEAGQPACLRGRSHGRCRGLWPPGGSGTILGSSSAKKPCGEWGAAPDSRRLRTAVTGTTGWDGGRPGSAQRCRRPAWARAGHRLHVPRPLLSRGGYGGASWWDLEITRVRWVGSAPAHPSASTEATRL